MAAVQLGRTLGREEIELIVSFLRTLTGRVPAAAAIGAGGPALG